MDGWTFSMLSCSHYRSKWARLCLGKQLAWSSWTRSCFNTTCASIFGFTWQARNACRMWNAPQLVRSWYCYRLAHYTILMRTRRRDSVCLGRIEGASFTVHLMLIQQFAQLGKKQTEPCGIPTLVPGVASLPMRSVSAGARHSAYVLSTVHCITLLFIAILQATGACLRLAIIDSDS